MWRGAWNRKAANWTRNLIQFLAVWTWAGSPYVDGEMQQKGSKLDPQPYTIPNQLDLGGRPRCGAGYTYYYIKFMY